MLPLAFGTVVAVAILVVAAAIAFRAPGAAGDRRSFGLLSGGGWAILLGWWLASAVVVALVWAAR